MATNDITQIVILGAFTNESAQLVIGELVTHDGRPHVITWAQADIRGDLTLQLSESLTDDQQRAAVAERSAGARAALSRATSPSNRKKGPGR